MVGWGVAHSVVAEILLNDMREPALLFFGPGLVDPDECQTGGTGRPRWAGRDSSWVDRESDLCNEAMRRVAALVYSSAEASGRCKRHGMEYTHSAAPRAPPCRAGAL